MDFLREFGAFLRERKKYWLVPLLIILLLFSMLIILTQGTALAPFIYSIF
jgi:competence protein ComGC